ncbi:MAG: hypothetical protein CVU46_09330 [Chloroflexi bacterium HGW-Chloroflexi-8]|nr:MAG: hypothetical protein CVU46_09330 [Chloroflexi bacterium HGW-Chloroflexi-8]
MTDQNFDFLIIGGGLAGCALAYYLVKTGASVLLLEAKSICSGTSAACAGRAQIIESETIDYLKMVINGYSNLPNLGQELETDLDWETRGHLTLIANQEQWTANEQLVLNLNRLDIPAKMMDAKELLKIEPNINTKNCLGAAFSQEGHLNSFKLCFGFAHAAKKKGAKFLINSRVTGFIRKGTRIIGLQVGQSNYYGDSILLATGAWTAQIAEMIGQAVPILHTHAEAIVCEPIPKIINHHIGVSGFYETVHGSQRSVTLGVGQHSNGSLIISNAIQPEERINLRSSSWGMPAIVEAFLNIFPQLGNLRVLRTWAAPSPFSADHLPIIGRLPDFDNVFIAAGFHLAIPTIPLLAEEIAKSLTELDFRESSLLSPFSPNRFLQNAYNPG